MGTAVGRSTAMMSFLRGLLVTVAAVLLLSMGGAIVAAPMTLPLLYASARSSNNSFFRGIAGSVAALTALEVVWAIIYLTVGEAKPWIWLIPLISAIAMAVAIRRTHALSAQG